MSDDFLKFKLQFFFGSTLRWLLLKPLDTEYNIIDSLSVVNSYLGKLILLFDQNNKYQLLNEKHGVDCITILCVQ